MGLFDYFAGKEGYLPDTQQYIRDFENWTKTGTSISDIQKSISGEPVSGDPPNASLTELYKGTTERASELWGAYGWMKGGISKTGRDIYNAPGYYMDKSLGIMEEGVKTVTSPFGAVATVVTEADPSKIIDMSWIGNLIPEGGMFQMPEIKFPAIDLSPFAAGLAAMGAGIGGGLGIDTSLTDDEGSPNMIMIAALAAGLGGIYLITKD